MTLRPTRRRGMMNFASVFVVLALAALLATVWNVSLAAHRKVEAQNAADAAAHAAGIQAARGMNEITTINHLAGELLALAVLAHTPGGPELEAGAAPTPDPVAARELDAAVLAARLAAVPPNDAVVRKVRAAGASGGAIGAARRTLLGVLTESLQKHTVDPAAALRTQAAVGAEWDTLDRLEAVARAEHVPLKQRCVGTLIPDLTRHARTIAEGTPMRMDATAADVGRVHGTEASYLPAAARPALPVVRETELVTGGWERSQAVRAATPWVQFWRQPVFAFADRHLPLSRYADHTLTWSNTFTLLLARQLGDADAYLYVLADSGGEKGTERWAAADGAARADELFAHVWAARRPAADVFGRGLFRQPRPSGTTAVAQVMLYNANPQTPAAPPPTGEWQRGVGWDTLNWDAPVPEYAHGLRRDDAGLVRQPRVRVNWRVKLTPVTRPLPAPYDFPVPTH